MASDSTADVSSKAEIEALVKAAIDNFDRLDIVVNNSGIYQFAKISSFGTRILPAESAIYSGSKGALDAITGVLSRELGPRGIRVNSVNPGMIETEGTHAAGVMGSEFQTWNEGRTPLGR